MSEEGKKKPNNNKREAQDMTRIDRPKRECRNREILTFEEDLRWTTQEKEKLLEALHRHSPSAVESISQVIGSRTAKQVEDFMEKIMNSSCLEYSKRVVELDPEKGAAPLELWLSLVQELVREDKKVDHSAYYSKVLRVTARNESLPEDSGFANLKWKNLYQYVSDLLDDKAVLQPLTNMESLVMLDMMHSLGDTLHSTDTKEQRKMLDLKYQLYRWQTTNSDGKFTAGLKAVNNDFTDIEYTRSSKPCESSLETTTTATTTTSSSSEIPSTSTLSSNAPIITTQGPNPGPSQPIYLLPIIHPQPQTTSTNDTPSTVVNQQATPSLPPLLYQSSPLCVKTENSSNTTMSATISTTTAISTNIKIEPDNSTASSITQPHHNLSIQDTPFSSIATTTASVSKGDYSSGPTMTVMSSSTETVTATINSTTSCTTQPHQNLSVQDTETSTTTANVSNVDNSSDSNTENISKGGDFIVPNTATTTTTSSKQQREDSFKLPDLFSLNPLTIPSHLLPLKSKEEYKEEKQIPVLIDIQ